MLSATIHADTIDSLRLRKHIEVLSSKGMAGRGYVNKGMDKAAKYVMQEMRDYGLEPLFGSAYGQAFTYAVNTFPSAMDLKVNGKTYVPGKDFLIHPGSSGLRAEELKMVRLEGDSYNALARKKNADKAWAKFLKDCKKQGRAYLLSTPDSLKSAMGWKSDRELQEHLPARAFLMQKNKKPIWPVSRFAHPSTLLELYDTTATLNEKDKITITVDQVLAKDFKAENVGGMVRGTVRPDSFLVVTAHYDHIGKMGNKALFPGASDNASGTAMLLELARYFAAKPPRYSVVFIAFAGEEAGLLGSEYFVNHPVIALERIRFLVNLDILGDASDGISVVNGTLHEKEFELLRALNGASENGFRFPEIRKGGTAANSDHHPFSERGVPAFFIFSMGGKGFYHDIWDKADQVTLTHIEDVGRLVVGFLDGLENGKE